ncbi:glycosyltransferase family 4 protein [Photobacterium aquimaris]|uniref:Glycosyl transferase n=1 Tax=Photobacterium aquimaris TaxID=512643 RepID=A0A2T3HTV6_9GAMM|nr:glycosyltransferase family 4 protein [Photobacterium aquimaris]OBU21975.1 glycosyl transferase [Photobacterium aquimaris]PQJ40922.1 glycosyl transferase [Photobacterium aquimaris]PST98940.1 glycosyl transferase [Photobacterium aquimaris]
MKSQTKSLRIWLVIDSKDVGGIESHILQLAQGLKLMQHDITILFLCRYHKQHPLLPLCDNNYINYQFLSGSIGSLLQHTLKNPPNVIHSHGYKAAIYCRLIRLTLLLSSLKIRFINTFHAGEIPTGKVKLYDAIDRWSACLNHVNLAVSDAIKHRIPFKTELINNFIDTDALTLSHGQQIAFVGRLSNEKAPDRFVELARRLPQFSFHIYGDGPLDTILRQQAPTNLLFHGQQQSMDPIWQQIGLLVICSRYEGLPMVALEAMGRGIPLISTPVGNIHQLIQSDINGWIIEPPQLAAAITHWSQLSKSHRKQIQQMAQRMIKQHYSAHVVIPRLLSLYNH